MISVALPLYNEEEMLDLLFSELIPNLKQISEDYEIVCVDDGSDDATLTKLLEYHQKDKRIKVLELSRNFGLQGALTAAMTHVRGDYVIFIDGDLQDPPNLIPEMYKKLVTENLDIVFIKRDGRKEKIFRKLLIQTFHKLFNKFSNINMPPDVGNFSIMNRKSLDALLQLQEKNRYLTGLRFYVGFKQGFIKSERPDRKIGKAKMTYSKLISLALDALFSFSSVPIKLCLIIGFVGIVISTIGGIYVITHKMMGIAIVGWTSILLSVYFFGSVHLFFLGIIGEYIFRIFKETQNRPLYIVDTFHS